jgi:hypothetical protein
MNIFSAEYVVAKKATLEKNRQLIKKIESLEKTLSLSREHIDALNRETHLGVTLQYRFVCDPNISQVEIEDEIEDFYFLPSGYGIQVTTEEGGWHQPWGRLGRQDDGWTLNLVTGGDRKQEMITNEYSSNPEELFRNLKDYVATGLFPLGMKLQP